MESTGSDVWQHGGIRAEGTDAGTGGDAGFYPRIWRVPGCHIPAAGLKATTQNPRDEQKKGTGTE